MPPSPHSPDREDGQVALLLLAACAAFLLLGAAIFQVGLSSDLRGRGRTAADAAALAAATELEAGWSRQLGEAADTGDWARVRDLLAGAPAADDPAVREAAQDYAARNDAQLAEYSSHDADISVGVVTDGAVHGNLVERAEVHGEARASAGVRLRCTLRPPASAPSGWQAPAPPVPTRLDCPGRPQIPLAKGSERALKSADLFTVRLVS
ncbi:hypothetical protein [Kitasatospora sp. NPDC059571]|uniref:hypothetical protein n=1 Tax=Kitasatospora sp. NPDC059571 TaxID=3346871 RepID=UPI0036812CA2